LNDLIPDGEFKRDDNFKAAKRANSNERKERKRPKREKKNKSAWA
jgi:hypothetical protein